jgi:cobalamin biosynthesis Mg chelatase CobN
MKLKAVLSIILALGLLAPSLAEARGFSSSHSSFHSSSSRSSFSSSRSSSIRSSSPSRTRSSVSLTKSKSSASTSKPKSSSSKSFSGKTSTKTSATTAKSGSFSGKTSTVRGKTYTSAPTRRSYNGRNVSVNHYYNAGYSPSGWFGYYHGFSTGMFMGSMMHPWGSVYPMGGHYASYGASPIAWIADIIALILLIVIAIVVFKALSPRRKIYSRRF